MIAWRDLRGLRDPDRFDAWLHRLAHQRLHRPGDARAPPDREPPGAAGRRTGRARRPAQRRRPGPARTRVPPAAARPAGDPRAAPLPRATPRPRSPRRSASRPGTARSRLHHAHRAMRAALEADARTTVSGRSIGMTQQRDIERLLDHWFADGPDQAPDRVVDDRRRPDRAPAPATRVAPPLEAISHERLHRRSRSPRRPS